MAAEPVVSLRRRQELSVLTSYSESVFLLASQMSIGRKPVELLPAPVGKGYVLQCEWPYFQLPFEEVLTPVSELLLSCGASRRVGKFWSEPSPVFDVDFDSQASIEQMVDSLESGQVREGMESIILSLTETAWSQTNPDAIPECKLDISLELLQVLPNADTKDAIIHRVSSTNISMCAHLWNERKVFDIGALLRWYRSKPLGGFMGESPAASGDIQLLDLVRELKEVVGWMRLGLQLGVPKHTLETIRCQYAMYGEEIAKTEMLSTWLDGHTEEPTWAEVVSAVSRTGNKRVARRIADKYGFTLASLTETSTATQACSVAMAAGDPLEAPRIEVEDTHGVMEEIESRLQFCMRKKQNLESNLAETQNKCDCAQRYTESLTKEKASLKQTLEAKETELRTLQAQQLENKYTIHKLEVKLATASVRAKLEWLKREKEELVERIEAKQKEISKLKKKINVLKSKLEQVKKELSDVQKLLKRKTSQLDEVQHQLQLVWNQRKRQEVQKVMPEMDNEKFTCSNMARHLASMSCSEPMDLLAQREQQRWLAERDEAIPGEDQEFCQQDEELKQSRCRHSRCFSNMHYTHHFGSDETYEYPMQSRIPHKHVFGALDNCRAEFQTYRKHRGKLSKCTNFSEKIPENQLERSDREAPKSYSPPTMGYPFPSGVPRDSAEYSTPLGAPASSERQTLHHDSSRKSYTIPTAEGTQEKHSSLNTLSQSYNTDFSANVYNIVETVNKRHTSLPNVKASKRAYRKAKSKQPGESSCKGTVWFCGGTS